MNDFEIQEPIEFANFIVEFANNSGKKVTNLQLQKVMYFSQAAFLLRYNSPLIEGEFSRWQYGPVIQEVYSLFRHNGSSAITNVGITGNSISDIFKLSNAKITSGETLGSDDVFEYVRNVVSRLLEQNPWELVKITHQQEAWASYKNEIDSHSAPNYNNGEIKDSCRKYSYLWEMKK